MAFEARSAERGLCRSFRGATRAFSRASAILFKTHSKSCQEKNGNFLVSSTGCRTPARNSVRTECEELLVELSPKYPANEGRSYVVDQSIAELEQKLDPTQFLRVHREVLVNLSHVQDVDASIAGPAADASPAAGVLRSRLGTGSIGRG